jgi:hypothetical protein
MLLNNPALIQCHYTVITMEIVFYNTELQYYCVIAVNYHDKKFFDIGHYGCYYKTLRTRNVQTP